MKFLIQTIRSFHIRDLALWFFSILSITLSFILVHNTDYMTLGASLVGATSLIFIAKGNVIGQFLMVAFAVLYGIISYYCRYYGEMITYLGMTTPIALLSIVTWLKHSHNGNKSEVKINTLPVKEYVFLLILSVSVTIAFYFILRAFHTANLFCSTISVFTSFVASYFELRRSELYAISFVANDCVLIVLWTFATLTDLNYLAMVVCFGIFLINDVYGFILWRKTKIRQSQIQSGQEATVTEQNGLNCQ